MADPNVIVLDPCCGTGAYLRAVLRRIARTLHDKGGDALIANDLKKAAMERVFGFEILPAPFVIAHLQLGLELETLGAPLSGSADHPERVGVYLTNALTGWDPPKEKPKQITFPGFEEERDAAGKVKQEKPILVILGNPPYNAFAGVSPVEESGLVEPYKQGLISEWGIKKFNLDDLYVRFFRLAEKRIAEKGGRGVVSFISNFSYLGDPSFVVMRQRFLNEFDSLWLDCMNGDSRETGKLTPEGKPDPSVFSTEYNREGIRVGTAIGLLVKTGKQRATGELPVVRFRHFWGSSKRAELLASLEAKDFDAPYQVAAPAKENRWSFRPSEVSSHYLEWPKLTDLCEEAPSNGLMEKRGGALMEANHSELEMRMRRYFDKDVSFEELKAEGHLLSRDAARYDAKKARAKLLSKESFNPLRIRRYVLRPFDPCWCYFTSVRPLWNEPRPSLWAQYREGNKFLMSRPSGVANIEGIPFYFTNCLGDNDFLRGHAYYFAFLKRKSSSLPLLTDKPSTKDFSANLCLTVREYLASLGFANPDIDQETAEMIWYHALAIGYSSAYLNENADGIRQDWPRIPLPDNKDILFASASLGREVALLLDTETPVQGVSVGKIRDDLKSIAVFERVDGKQAKPEAGDLDVTAGWGHSGKGGITMPGKGKIIDNGESLDIYLNDNACWRNVPKEVWQYLIGGYQVIKKWLSYREKTLLGRGLTPDEVRYVTETARRLTALVAMQPSLDGNYRNVIKATYLWPKQ